MVYQFEGIKIRWIGHDGFLISNGVKVVIDPYQTKIDEKADLILISHDHYDHLSLDDLKRVISPETIILAAQSCIQQLSSLAVKEVRGVTAGENTTVRGVGIRVLPAYNVNKFRKPGEVFHPKEAGGVGFIVTLGSVKVYHSGDADHIPEMKGLEVDVALLPVSGTYVMTAEEAARATAEINPRVAIPMHFGAIVGDRRDAEKFKDLAHCEVNILTVE